MRTLVELDCQINNIALLSNLVLCIRRRICRLYEKVPIISRLFLQIKE